MSFAWETNEWVARELQRLYSTADNQMKAEALLRSSISRAYYSVHRPCEDYHKSRWGEPKQADAGMHKRLLLSFRGHSEDLNDQQERLHHQKISADLKRLYDLRIQADYKEEFPSLDSKAPVVGSLARGILHLLNMYSPAQRDG